MSKDKKIKMFLNVGSVTGQVKMFIELLEDTVAPIINTNGKALIKK